MTEWPELIDDIQAQLIELTKDQGDFLEGFNIFITNQGDDKMDYLLPYCVIVAHNVTPFRGFLNAKYASIVPLDFRLAFLSDTNIFGVNYEKDQLMQYVLKHLWEWLMSYTVTDSTAITVYEKDVPESINIGEATDPNTNQILHAGYITWNITILNEVLA